MVIIENDIFNNIKTAAENINISEISGSYDISDCTFLLKDISKKIKVISIDEKEKTTTMVFDLKEFDEL